MNLPSNTSSGKTKRKTKYLSLIIIIKYTAVKREDRYYMYMGMPVILIVFLRVEKIFHEFA